MDWLQAMSIVLLAIEKGASLSTNPGEILLESPLRTGLIEPRSS